MKVAHIGSNSVHVSRFIEALNTHAVEQVLIAETPVDINFNIQTLLVDFHTFNPFTLLRNKRLATNFLKEFNPDIIHIHQVNRIAFWIALIAKKLNIPVVTTAWGSDVLLMPQKNWLYRYLVTKTLQNSKLVTADADVMLHAMQNLVPAGVRYEKIQYGIDPVELTLNKEKIVYSNRLHKSLYRVDKIIEYFAEASAHDSNYQLIIAATGDESEKLKNLVVDLNIENKVEFVGWVNAEQNRYWYSKAQFYVSIPSSDGTSVSLLEAISAGCIPIVSDLPANLEWVKDGNTGIIEQPNENPILKAFQSQFDNALIENAQHVNKLASRSFTVPQFITFYHECISR